MARNKKHPPNTTYTKEPSKRGEIDKRSKDHNRYATPQRKVKSTNNIKKPAKQHTTIPSTIVQWNICGLRGKIPELQLMSNEIKPKIIALQETLFDNSKYVDRLDNRRYKWYLRAGNNATKNGVAIAIDRTIPHTPIALKTKMQAIACKTLGKNETTYVSIYIPPRKQTPQEIKQELIDLIKQLPKPFILLGDFNAHSTEWGSFKTDRWGTAILEVVQKLNLHILNNGKSTKTSKNSTCMSAIDLTITSDNNKTLRWEVDSDCRSSDHFPILITEGTQNKYINQKPNWDHRKANWKKFQETLMATMNHNNINTIESITQDIHRAAIDSIPKTKRPTHRKVPWWNEKVEQCIKARKAALRRLKLYKHNDKTKIYLVKRLNITKQKATKVLKEAKKASWENFLSTIDDQVSNTKELWNKIHALSGKSHKQDITLTDGVDITENPTEIANQMADHFYEQSATNQYNKKFQRAKAAAEAKNLNLNYSSDKIYNKNFTMEELNLALSKAKGRATGIDEISYDMLRHLPLKSKIILLEAYNKIWNQDRIPETWKTGLIVPILKDNGNPHDIKNYRPITLLSCMGKIMERMINTRLITEIEEKCHLNPHQFAFRPGRSTDEYFTELEGTLAPALEEDKHIECALLDLSKAYDKAWRRPILEQLKKWNIEGNMINYIEDFLSERKFQVEIGTTRSSNRIQENGIPQGAVISVTLFLIAMNSMISKYRKTKEVKVLVYADDILIIVMGKVKRKLRTKLQKITNKIVGWAENKGFTIAPHKSKIIHICNQYKHSTKIPKIEINGQTVPTVKSAKILGITIDSRFNFKPHMLDLKKSIVERCNMIKAIGGRNKGANRRTMLRVFNALVLSKILYGAHLYSRGDQKVWDIIGPQYNQTIRTITGALRTSRVSSILAETGMLPLDKHIKLNTITKAIKWLELHDNNQKIGQPLIQRANNFATELTGEPIPNISRRPNPIGKKWHEPKTKIDWSIKKKIKAGEQSTKTKQIFLETRNKYSNHKIIYTDGSVKDDEVGCGIYSQDENIPIKLNKMCTIFSAESRALLIASKKIANTDQPCIIFSDSAGCLEALDKGETQHPWLEEVLKQTQNKDITFCWVPSHVGITGNEKADKLAELGRQSGTAQLETPANDAIKWYKTRTIWSNEAEWRRQDESFLRRSKPTTLPWKDRKKVKEQRILTRVRIGHTWLSHGYILHKEPPPRCKHCNDRLTIDHIIRICPEFEESRKKHNITGLSIYNNMECNERNLLNFLTENKLIEQL